MENVQQLVEAFKNLPISVAGIPPLFLLFYMVFSMILGVVMTVYIVRLSSLDHNLEKAVILLTVLANKQGANEEDIRRALGPAEVAVKR